MASSIFIYKSEQDSNLDNYGFFREIIYFDDTDLDIFIKDPGYFLDKYVGRKRIVNPRQFEIIKGSVVRSKSDPRLGPGVVNEINDDLVTVIFPNSRELYSKNNIKCHISTLRVINHIEEIKKHERP